MIRTTTRSKAGTMIRSACLSLAVAAGGLFNSGTALTAQEVQAVASPQFAAEAPALYEMLDALGIYEIIALMSTENIQGGIDLEPQLFPGAGGAAWQAAVTRLHQGNRMAILFEEAFDRDAATAEQIAAVQEFATSEVGQRLVSGEIEARRAFLDADAVSAASDEFLEAVAEDDPRIGVLRALNDVNGLVERNVIGALNLRLAFYRGLIDGGAFDNDVPEGLMLSEVWSQEAEVREMTIEWLYGYQLRAYAEASEADLRAYMELAGSEAGRAVNNALFNAFDAMLTTLSYELGAAAAPFIAGEDT